MITLRRLSLIGACYEIVDTEEKLDELVQKLLPALNGFHFFVRLNLKRGFVVH